MRMAKSFRHIKRKPPTLKAALKAGKLKAAERASRIFVAVIVRQGFSKADRWKFESGRSDDGWYALIGDDKQALVTVALAQARGFETASGQKYEVAVGTLDELVVIPTFFEYQTL